MENRKKMKQNYSAHVFLSCIPDYVSEDPVSPVERELEITSCKNESVRKKKRFVWQLLEAAVKEVTGLSLCNLDIGKTENGKWVCDRFCFSLSHSKHYAAVVISNRPVGIDIEDLPDERLTGRLYGKIASEAERRTYGDDPDQETICRLWTAKESVFKMGGGRAFDPRTIDTSAYPVTTKTFFDHVLVVSVCGEEQGPIEYCTLDPLDRMSVDRIAPDQ